VFQRNLFWYPQQMKKRLMYSIGCLVAIGAAFWISFFFQPKEKEASLGAPTPNDAFP
jgi:hypothetical protein